MYGLTRKKILSFLRALNFSTPRKSSLNYLRSDNLTNPFRNGFTTEEVKFRTKQFAKRRSTIDSHEGFWLKSG